MRKNFPNTVSIVQSDREPLNQALRQENSILQQQQLRRKYAVLSMDVEDWYHTGYLDEKACDRSYSMLGGLDQFIQILTDYKIDAQLFVVGEVLKSYPAKFRELQKLGHELASHGWNHRLPSKISITEFTQEMQRCQRTHEDLLGASLYGYRAPCFSLDETRINALIQLGFQYDSSSIQRMGHCPLNLRKFTPVDQNIFRQQDFFEFQIANFSANFFKWPTSGGGAMRIFPWQITQAALEIQLQSLNLYSLYLHPIDISLQANPPFPTQTHWLHKWRFNQGRFLMVDKLKNLILNLQQYGYQFTTYSKLRTTLLDSFSSIN